jgi:methylated-DNA-protein-cysteine methyltransferase-like protein
VNFYQQVYALVKAIPYGHVATYGQIAAALGSPRAARQVGQALKNCDQSVPWQRVINRHGMISIENMHVPKDEQAQRLRQEGVTVTEHDNNFWVDLQQYLVDSTILTQAKQLHYED